MRKTWLIPMLALTLTNTAIAQAVPATEDEITEVLDKLDRYYYKPIDREALRRGAAGGISGMLRVLNNDLTYFISENDPILRGDGTTSHGVLLEAASSAGTGAKVLSVTRFSSAWRNGLQPGDTIEAIDNRTVTNLELGMIELLLPQDNGKTVQLTVRRSGTSRQISLQREPTRAVVLEREAMPVGMAYLTINTFSSPDLVDEVKKALTTLSEAGVNKLVLDLRDNPGGTLSNAVDIADFFLKSGNIVGLKTKDGREEVYGRARQSGYNYEGKVVVLANKHTTSGAEVVASSLQKAGVKVFGEQTAGKALAGLPVNLESNGGRLIVSNAALFTEAGVLHGRGVTPNVKVTDDRRAPVAAIVDLSTDRVLKRALQELGRTR